MVYSPNTDPFVNAVMIRVASRTGLSLENDIIGVSTKKASMEFLYDHFGAVQNGNYIDIYIHENLYMVAPNY